MTSTPTPTRTSAGARTQLELRADRAGTRTALTRLAGGDLVALRPLPAAGAVARAALVQSAAALLAGDRLEIRLALGPEAALELVEVAATVAHPAGGGPAGELDVGIRLAPGAVLHWDARALVLAAGRHLRRGVRVDLAAGARALLRDTLVLGRAGEAPGRLESRTSVRLDGRPLHDETLDTGDLDLLRSSVVLGDARVLDVLARYGDRGEAPGALQLEGPGTLLVVGAGAAADAQARIEPVRRRWAAELAQRTRSRTGSSPA